MDEAEYSVEETIGKRHRLVVWVYIVEAAAVVALALVGAVVLPLREAADERTDLTALWILMLFVAAGSFVLRRAFWRWERLRDKTLLRGMNGLLSTLQADALILGSIAAAIGIAGFIATVVSGERTDVVRASVVALIILGINFPRRSIWDKIVLSLRDEQGAYP